MKTEQTQIRILHDLPVETGNVVFKTFDTRKRAPINDARQREDERGNTIRRLFSIFVMLGVISYLVWSLG